VTRDPRTADLIAYTTFAMTGVGVVLPGNLLPVLLARWSISDEHAGYLFLVFFVASTSGALLSRGNLSRSIARGCFLIALGMGSLGMVSGAVAFISVAVYGLGLGIAMTSVSLRQSRQYPSERTAQMARLNLLWAIGACFGPFVVLRGAAIFGPQLLLYAVASIFAVLGLLSLWLLPSVAAEPSSNSQRLFSKGAMPALLLLLVPLATGIESGTGGWLATYSNRSGHDLNITITTVTCFWAGMLLSRLAQSYRPIAAASTKLILRWSPWLITAALLLVLGVPSGPGALSGAFLLGTAVGPLYPLLIALCLHFGEAGNIVFVFGGMGAAFFPWLTGLVSTWTGSLRAGLSVLLLASTLLALLGWRLSRRHGDI
jgi:FHS family glucose/mannose:H+ symporter-like MFS transporter